MDLIGREAQIRIMQKILKLRKSSFVAITGRRRVGKTFLVDQVYKDYFCFTMTGIQDVSQEEQILNFTQKLAEYSGFPIVSPPDNWQQALLLFKAYLKRLPRTKKAVIFLDELPWIATKRSGFTQHLAHLWNDYLSKENHFILVICGSATSWIAEKIINDKGGFHNRISHNIHLQPFNLKETKLFLTKNNIKLTQEATIQLYMALGGIPYYLEQIERGTSIAANINRICFDKNGILFNEYNNLFKALYNHPENHEAIVSTLANAPKGLTRKEIINRSKVAAGGPYNRAMEDLLTSGFVEEVLPFGRKKRGAHYRLIDEYSLFYHKFIHSNSAKRSKDWQTVAQSQTFKIWAGYAFENICIKHVDQLKKALGISGVLTTMSGYYQPKTQDNQGYQIDIVIDRKDDVINLCECKYYDSTFTISKAYANRLDQRRDQFRKDTGTRKNIFNTLITLHPVPQNEYCLQSVDYQLEAKILFD